MPQTLKGHRATVITVSDRCHAGTQQDASGPALVQVLEAFEALVAAIVVVPDEREQIAAALLTAAIAGSALIVTTGGTGLAPRDVTPEATMDVCQRLVPGVAELIRLDGAKQTPFSALSRGVCATLDHTAGSALVLNLPGSPTGAESSLRAVLGLLPHALDLLGGKTRH